MQTQGPGHSTSARQLFLYFKNLKSFNLNVTGLISPCEVTGEADAWLWCVGAAVPSRSGGVGGTLRGSQGKSHAGAFFDDETNRTDTKNNSTNVSDKQEKHAHTAAFLFLHLPPSNSDKPLIPKMDKKKPYERK